MSESSIVARLNQVPQWNSFKPVADTAASVINDLETELSAKTRELAEAKAEAELLREDAERYRWLRENGDKGIYVISSQERQEKGFPMLDLAQGDELDCVIDSAIQGGERGR